MTNFGQGIIMGTISFLMNILFMSNIFASSKRTRGGIFYLLMAIIIIITTSRLLRSEVLIKILVNMLIASLAFKFFYKITIWKSLFFNSLYYLVSVLSELFIFLCMSRWYLFSRYEDITNTGGAFLIELLSQIFVFIVIMGMSAFIRRSNLSRMNLREWAMFFMFPLFTLGIIVMLVVNTDHEMLIHMRSLYLFIGAGLMLFNVGLVFLLDNVIGSEIELEEKREQLKRTEQIYNEYKVLAEQREQMKAQVHDYRNHMNTILTLITKDEKSELIAYINDQLDNMNDLYEMFDTGNSIINAVINRKYQEGRTRGIQLTVISDGMAELKIGKADIVTILSNILDNAIEASERSEKKRILLKLRIDEKSLHIVCINNCNDVGFAADIKQTTKSDKEYHGYGLKNIRNTVLKNDGECFITRRGETFQITIRIPLCGF